MSNLPPIDASWWFCGWWLTQGFQRCFLQVFFFCRRFLIYLILANGGFPFPAPRKNNQTLQFNIHLNIGGINVTWDSEYSNLYCYKAEFLCHSFKNLKPINFNKKNFILQKVYFTKKRRRFFTYLFNLRPHGGCHRLFLCYMWYERLHNPNFGLLRSSRVCKLASYKGLLK